MQEEIFPYFLRLCKEAFDEEAQKSPESVGVSYPCLIIKLVCSDHNEQMGPGSGTSGLENPDTLKKTEITDCAELGS